jgi:hypothetical protein
VASSQYGAIVKHSPAVSPAEGRPVFNFSEAGSAGAIKWFLPQGLTQECLFNAPQTCDYSNTIRMPSSCRKECRRRPTTW